MRQYLEDDEADLRELTDNAVNKLEKISDEQFESVQEILEERSKTWKEKRAI